MFRYRVMLLCGGILTLLAPGHAQQFDGFQGPSILSRGTRPIGRSGARPVRFRGYAGIGAGWFSGLSRAATDEQGRFSTDQGVSGMATWGGYGSQAGKRSQGSVSYNGAAQIFGNAQYYSGVNHFLSAGYSTVVTRRWSAFVGASASQQNLLLGINSSPFAQEYFDRPVTATNEVFDSPFYSFSGGAGLSYRKSARTSFTMSGAGMTVKRRAAGFIGQEGYTASGEVSHMLSRRTTVGVGYSFGHVFFRKAYGESYIHTVMANAGRVLNPHWTLTVGAGTYRVTSDRIQAVEVDPLVAALTGQRTAPQAFNDTTGGLAVAASLNGTYRVHTTGVSYSRGATPGNGLYLTSEQESVGAAYSYGGLRRANMGVQATYGRMRPLLRTINTLGRWEAYGVGAGFGYRLTGFLHFGMGAQAFQSRAAGTRFDNLRYGVTAGLYFSPGEVPLLLW